MTTDNMKPTISMEFAETQIYWSLYLPGDSVDAPGYQLQVRHCCLEDKFTLLRWSEGDRVELMTVAAVAARREAVAQNKPVNCDTCAPLTAEQRYERLASGLYVDDEDRDWACKDCHAVSLASADAELGALDVPPVAMTAGEERRAEFLRAWWTAFVTVFDPVINFP